MPGPPKGGHYQRMRGTPTQAGGQCLLSPELHKELVHNRRHSPLFDTQIAMRCGIAHSTLKRWLAQGLTENAIEPYKTFAKDYINASIDQEEEIAAKTLKGEIGKHGQDWRATQWWLGQRYPRRWGGMQPEQGSEDAIDVQRLIEDTQQREQTLNELLTNPPPELESALLDNREAILALLGAAPAEEPEVIELPPGESEEKD